MTDKMTSYAMKIRRCLIRECVNTKRQQDKKNRIYDYVQRELAYNSCKLDGNKLTRQQVKDMYHSEKIYSTQMNEELRVNDIIEIKNHFDVLSFLISDSEIKINFGLMVELYDKYLDTVPFFDEEEIEYMEREQPTNISEIATYHSKLATQYEENRTIIRLISFLQCMNARIIPFIIHAENQLEYESRLADPENLEKFFVMEQEQFFRDMAIILEN